MLTIDTLRSYGADVEDGLNRCMNYEQFYLELVRSVMPDPKVEELAKAVRAGDLDNAFELAHALKGMFANLALTPLLTPVCEITELLRARTQTDYEPLLAQIQAAMEALRKLED